MRNKNTKKEVELGTETKETKKGWAKYLDEAKGLERDYMTELAQSRKRSMMFLLNHLYDGQPLNVSQAV